MSSQVKNARPWTPHVSPQEFCIQTRLLLDVELVEAVLVSTSHRACDPLLPVSRGVEHVLPPLSADDDGLLGHCGQEGLEGECMLIPADQAPGPSTP